MSSPSVSFRISRHTEDLAETLHALSHRLVAMEQRLATLELQLQELARQPREEAAADRDGIARAEANIERLLLDCRQLLTEAAPGREQSLELAGSGDSVTPAQPQVVSGSLSEIGRDGAGSACQAA